MNISTPKRKLGLIETASSQVENAHVHGEHSHHEHDQTLEKAAEVRAQAILVLGPLGSGKTSLVKWMLGRNGKVFGKLRLIINDVGSENIDAGRLAEDVDLASDDVSALKSGCICCEDLDSLVNEVKKVAGDLDTIIIEPTGIAEGDTIAAALAKIGVKSKVVTLMDVQHHERRTAAEMQIIDTQLAVAKVIGLTWWEKASKEKLEEVWEYIGRRNQQAPVVKLPKLAFGEREILGDQNEPAYQQLLELMNGHDDGHSNVDESHHPHRHLSEMIWPSSFTDINADFSAADLENLLKKYADILIRAKGVIAGRRFNYVHGDLNWEKASADAPNLNFIASAPFDQEGLSYLLKAGSRSEASEIEAAYLFQLDQKINQYLLMNKTETLEFSRAEVDKLIGQYQQWMYLDAEISALKVARPASVANEQKIEAWQLEQKDVGEAMTFANPLVWMLYKIRAYAGSPKELKTLADLRAHSSSPTYICYKRLDYLNGALREKFGQNLLDNDSMAGETLLQSMVDAGPLVELSMDGDFMKKWQECEYFRQVDAAGRLRVAKWENYRREK